MAATALMGPIAAVEGGAGVAVAATVAAPNDVPPEPPAEPMPEPEDPREGEEEAQEPSDEPAPPPEDPRGEDDSEEEPSPDPPPEPSPEPAPEPEDPREGEDEEEESSPEPTPEPEEEDECGPIDLRCKVVQAFSGWLSSMVADFLNLGVMVGAISLMLGTPDTSGIRAVWSTAQAVGNSGYVLVVTIAGVLLMSHQTVQTSAGVKEVLPRLVLAFVASNASWLICQQLAALGNAISMGILGDTADPDLVTNTFERFLRNPREEFLITVNLMFLGSIAGIIFLFTVIIRLMLWILLTAAAPLALAAHALPQTEGLARLWWRAIGALLIMQVGQALVLRVAMTLFLAREGITLFDPTGALGSVIDLLVLIACLYVLIRVPFWAGKQVFNPSASPLVKGAKLATSILVFKGLGLGKAAAGQKAGKALTSAKTSQAGQRMATTRPPSGPAPPRRPSTPRWHQPALPGMRPGSSASSGSATGTQKPLPGIDSQIDPGEQQRLRERRRWVQPTLPSGELARPPHHRQEALPGMADTPRAHQDPLPGMSLPSQARQESLFEPTSRMRHAPDQRRSDFQQRQHQAERRRRAARQAAAQQQARPGRRQIPPRHRGRNEGGRF